MATAAATVLALWSGAPARAASFSVDPIMVTLAKGNTSASVAVVNQSPTKLRLQVTGFAWQQSPSGEMQLTPSEDLIFFPQLLTLDPGETRRIRVGVTAPNGPLEKTYRIFVEELPSLQSVVAPTSGAALTIRLKVGVPVFLAPAGPAKVAGAVSDAAVRAGSLEFDVANTGDVHFSVQSVDVVGRNASGATVFSQKASGWYVLAGQVRHYSLPLKDRCAAVSSVTVSVKTDSGPFTKSFSGFSKDCTATPHR